MFEYWVFTVLLKCADTTDAKTDSDTSVCPLFQELDKVLEGWFLTNCAERLAVTGSLIEKASHLYALMELKEPCELFFIGWLHKCVKIHGIRKLDEYRE